MTLTDRAPAPVLDHPEHILQIGMGFWASKTVLSAVELELFTVLGDGEQTAEALSAALDLAPAQPVRLPRRARRARVPVRDGDGPAARYANTPETAMFLDKRSPAYLGGILEMANTRLYGFWGTLTEALRTGEPQNEIKSGAPGLFEGIYAEPERLEVFLDGMQGLSSVPSRRCVRASTSAATPASVDIGGANGTARRDGRAGPTRT